MSQAGAKDVWTIGKVLTWTTQHFADRGIDSPRLDAELLLAHVLKQKRVYLYTHFDKPLSQDERDAYRAVVQRRARREPLAYIVGEREFYGRPFVVSPAVLVPRPETEHLIDAVRSFCEAQIDVAPPADGELSTAVGVPLSSEAGERLQRAKKAGEHPFRLVDVGTGSGAIAVTLAAELPAAQVWAVDVSPEALAIATDNARAHGVLERLQLVQGDLLTPVQASGPFDVVAANLPYIPAGEHPTLMPEVREHEPALALLGGADGLDLVRRLISQARSCLKRPGLLALEIGAGQFAEVARELEAQGYSQVRAVRDLAGIERIALGEWR